MLNKGELNKVLQDPFEELAYNHGYRLRGINFKVKEETWLMVVKAVGRLDGNVVAFIEAETHIGCWEYFATYLYRRGVPLKWRPDKWA